MSDTATQPIGIQTDDINITAIVTWGLVSVIITVCLILGLYGLYNAYTAEELQEKTYGVKYADTTATKKTQQDLLEQPIRYLDSKGKVLAVPIERAKELTLAEFGKQE